MSDKSGASFRLEIQGEREILNPTPQQIKEAIASLSLRDEDPFLILETATDGMTYMQAMLEKDSLWTVEFQEGSLEQHFQASEVSTKNVIDMFLAFAQGDEAWRTSVEWQRIEIEHD